MNTETASREPTDLPPVPPRRRLVRPVTDRSVAGVAAGLAAYLNVSVGLVRFGFLIALVFGGLGFVLYAAGWLLIPDETESESIARRTFDNLGSGPSWLGIGLLIVAGVIVLDNTTFLPGSLIWAGVLIAVGLLLYRGDIGPRPEGSGTAAQPASGVARDVLPRAGGAAPPLPPAPALPAGSPPPGPPTPPVPPSILGRLTMGVGLLAIGVLAVVDNATTLVQPQPRHYLALATVVVGLGLLVGAFVGRARWMILLGFLLVPPLMVSPIAEVEWDGQFERVVAPPDLGDLQPSYRSTAGSYLFDLSGTEWNGETVSLDVELAGGEIVIVLPPDVGLTGEATVGLGAIEAPDGNRVGIRDISRRFDLPGDTGTLDVDLDMGAGMIEIHRRDPSEIPGRPQGMRFAPGHLFLSERNR